MSSGVPKGSCVPNSGQDLFLLCQNPQHTSFLFFPVLIYSIAQAQDEPLSANLTLVTGFLSRTVAVPDVFIFHRWLFRWWLVMFGRRFCIH